MEKNDIDLTVLSARNLRMPPEISRMMQGKIEEQKQNKCLSGEMQAAGESRRYAEGSHVRKSRKRFLVFALAATLLFGGAVTAATSGKLTSVFEPFFRTKRAQNLVQNQLDVKVSGQEHYRSDLDEESMKMWKGWQVTDDSSALVTVSQTAYDGHWLYLTCPKTENGKKYDLDVGWMLVNGQEVPVSDASDDGQMLTVRADLSLLDLPEDFEVILPIKVFSKSGKRYQNQELTFTVPYHAGETEIAAVTVPVTFEHPEVKISVQRAEVTATGVHAVIRYQATEKLQDGVRPVLEILPEKDANEGTGYNDTDTWKTTENSVEEPGDGSWQLTVSYTGFREAPKHFYIATRFVRDGDRVHDKPPEYTDEVELEK